MIATDKPRPKKRARAALTDDAEAPSSLTAYCPKCGACTPMLMPKRTDKNSVAITTGKCSRCKHETYRVGAARSVGETDQ